jgi:hypothetical protein
MNETTLCIVLTGCWGGRREWESWRLLRVVPTASSAAEVGIRGRRWKNVWIENPTHTDRKGGKRIRPRQTDAGGGGGRESRAARGRAPRRWTRTPCIRAQRWRTTDADRQRWATTSHPADGRPARQRRQTLADVGVLVLHTMCIILYKSINLNNFKF